MKRFFISTMMIWLVTSSMNWAAEEALTPLTLSLRQIGGCAKAKVQRLNRNLRLSLITAIPIGCIAFAGWFYLQGRVATRGAPFDSMTSAYGRSTLVPLAITLGVISGYIATYISISKWYVNRRIAPQEQQVIEMLKRKAKLLGAAERAIKTLEIFKGYHNTKKFNKDEMKAYADFRENIGLSGRFDEQEHAFFCEYVQRAKDSAQALSDNIIDNVSSETVPESIWDEVVADDSLREALQHSPLALKKVGDTDNFDDALGKIQTMNNATE